MGGAEIVCKCSVGKWAVKLIAALAYSSPVHVNLFISRHAKGVSRTLLPAKPNAKKCHLPLPRFAGKVFWDTE
jgi:hypothetical protein